MHDERPELLRRVAGWCERLTEIANGRHRGHGAQDLLQLLVIVHEIETYVLRRIAELIPKGTRP